MGKFKKCDIYGLSRSKFEWNISIKNLTGFILVAVA